MKAAGGDLALRTTRLTAFVRRQVVPIGILAVLGAAAATRFPWLDLMEFKADEAEACRLALHALGYREPGVGTFFPTSGITVSLGVASPPLFIYVLAVPLALVRNPLAGAAFIAATNVVAVGLCYIVGKRFFSRFTGLVAAALFALSPWGILYSRKIWSPDLLPLCTCLFLIALHRFLVESRPRSVIGLMVLVAVASQFHPSAVLLVPVVAVAFVVGRRSLRSRHVVIGLAVVGLLYAPFLWHIAVVGHLHEAAPRYHPRIADRFLMSVRDTLAVGFNDHTSSLLGSQPKWASPFSFIAGTLSFTGLLISCRNWRKERLAKARALLVLWFLLPITALSVVPIEPFDHYFIVLYPLPFLGLAAILDACAHRNRLFTGVAIGALLAALTIFDTHLFRTLRTNGGFQSGYGIAYRYKLRTVESFVRANPSNRFELLNRFEHLNDPSKGVTEYRLLEWNIRGATARPLRRPARRYVLSANFHRRDQGRISGSRERFGPLQVIVVRLP